MYIGGCGWWKEKRERPRDKQEGTERTCDRVKEEQDEKMLGEVTESAVTGEGIV